MARYERKDGFYRRAKEEGFRSRAGYKLEDLLRRLPKLKRGARVVDLGCWPGAWLQVLADRVGESGCVVGVDLEATVELPPPVTVLELDFTLPEAPERIAKALGGPAALLVSDAASKLTGHRDVDLAAQEELWMGALAVADRVLAPGRPAVIKGFPGREADEFRAELKSRFGKVREVRPEGKRGTSKEFYWVCEPPARG